MTHYAGCLAPVKVFSFTVQQLKISDDDPNFSVCLLIDSILKSISYFRNFHWNWFTQKKMLSPLERSYLREIWQIYPPQLFILERNITVHCLKLCQKLLCKRGNDGRGRETLLQIYWRFSSGPWHKIIFLWRISWLITIINTDIYYYRWVLLQRIVKYVWYLNMELFWYCHKCISYDTRSI